MQKRLLNELSLNEKASFKDPGHGVGYVLGYNKEIGKHLIGYNAQCKRHSQAFANTTGQFVQNKENKYVYSDRVRDYTHFYYADSALELLNTETSADGVYRIGDPVDVQFNSNGQVVARGSVWDGSTTRRGTVVGMTDYGEPLLYMDVPAPGQMEYGMVFNSDINRWLDRKYDNQLNTNRAAFVNSAAVNISKASGKSTVREVQKEQRFEATKEKVMEKSFMEIMKSDAKTAAYRVASTQMTLGIKNALVNLMEKKGQSSERISALKEMLDTKFGEALVSYLAGMALTYAPVISEDPRAKTLAQEFRVSGVSTVGNEVIGIAMEHFMPVLQNALTNLPPAENEVKARVGASAPPVSEELEHTEKKSEQKTLTA